MTDTCTKRGLKVSVRKREKVQKENRFCQASGGTALSIIAT